MPAVRQAAGVPVRDAIDSAVVALAAAGVDTPRLDAEVLLAWSLGVPRTALLVDRGLVVTGVAIRRFREAVRRRAVEREPVAYITAIKGFRHLDVAVDPRVLIPRPETELLVEVALELPAAAVVLDVGTGSGAIALALKQERPDLQVRASDISEDALAVARANAARLGLDVEFARADLLELDMTGVDAIVSNPPYVEEGAALAPEITRHEPAQALFAGADGLDVVRRLCVQLATSPARWVALEIGAGQARMTEHLLARAGFAPTRSHRDLAGIERVVAGRRDL